MAEQHKTPRYRIELTQEQIEWIKGQIAREEEGALDSSDEETYWVMAGILDALSRIETRDPFVVDLRLEALETKVKTIERTIEPLVRETKRAA